MPVMYQQMPPAYAGNMYGQAPIMPTGQPMYYPSQHAAFSYFAYSQPSPYPPMNYGMSPFVMPQSPFGTAHPFAPYEMQMYGMPTSPTMQNINDQNAYGNNNINKPRRNNQYSNGNGMNYNNAASIRYNQPKIRDPNQARYTKSGDDALPSPSGLTATEVAVAALDSSNIPRSFSADADEMAKSPSVPVVSIPAQETAVPAVESTDIHVVTVDDSAAPVPHVQIEALTNNTDTDPEADRDSGNDKSPRNVARKEGKRDSNRSGSKNRSTEGDKRNGGRDGKSSQRQEKDGTAKRERKTPPVNLNLEKDFPTLVSAFHFMSSLFI